MIINVYDIFATVWLFVQFCFELYSFSRNVLLTAVARRFVTTFVLLIAGQGIVELLNCYQRPLCCRFSDSLQSRYFPLLMLNFLKCAVHTVTSSTSLFKPDSIPNQLFVFVVHISLFICCRILGGQQIFYIPFCWKHKSRINFAYCPFLYWTMFRVSFPQSHAAFFAS